MQASREYDGTTLNIEIPEGIRPSTALRKPTRPRHTHLVRVFFKKGFAVWRLVPERYNPKDKKGAYGGTLIECEPSPPMMAIDKECNCWVVQVCLGVDGYTYRC